MHFFKLSEPDDQRPLSLLLLRCAAGGGFWQGVTGGLEPGESPAQAARREVAEETGIVLAEAHYTNLVFSYPINAKWRCHYSPEVQMISEYVYAAVVPADVSVALSAEHSEYKWVPVEDAAKYLTAFETQLNAYEACRAWLLDRLE